jgi:hypothetical protein
MFRGSNSDFAIIIFLLDFEVLEGLASIRPLQCYNFGLVILRDKRFVGGTHFVLLEHSIECGGVDSTAWNG